MDIKKNLVQKYIRYFSSRSNRIREKRIVDGIHLYYRICDVGYPKEKPAYITKENCLRNAVVSFPLDKVCWHVIADNVCEETYQMICKYIPEECIERVSVGHGAGTFRLALYQALELNDNSLIYFLEDDYLHLPESLRCLTEAAETNNEDYITLYDHPDKYISERVSLKGAKRELYLIGTRHWRTTTSTTMTFAAFVDVLRRDRDVFMRWTETKHPYDYQIFVELGLLNKARLISPIPSLSTHGETEFLAPGIEWGKIAIQ